MDSIIGDSSFNITLFDDFKLDQKVGPGQFMDFEMNYNARGHLHDFEGKKLHLAVTTHHNL
jgi:hypothetical protein